MKNIDGNTINIHGIPSLVLMEKAAMAVCDVIAEENLSTGPVGVVCGIGNNGADGVAIARILHLKGISVKAVLLGNEEKYSQQLKEQIYTASSYGVEFVNMEDILDSPLIIDAIFGIGLSRPVEGLFADAINTINNAGRHGSTVLSVDIPSGYSSDNGNLLGVGIKADYTVTFSYIKKGLLLSDCFLNAGKLHLKDAGIYLDDDKISESDCFHLTSSDLRMVQKRERNVNKGSCGKLLIIAGSENIYGACYLSAKAAMTTGAGLVKVYTHKNNVDILKEQLPEAINVPYTEYNEEELSALLKWCDCLLIGPGIGTGAMSSKMLNYALQHFEGHIIIDADGLNILANYLYSKTTSAHFASNFDLSSFTDSNADIIITPHLMEMSRLTGHPVAFINQNMEQVARDFSAAHDVTVVLKNYVSVITDPGSTFINTTGCPGMATAGSGDVLAGIIAALSYEGLDSTLTAALGSFIHGSAGELAEKEKGQRGMLASDIINYISEVIEN